MNEATESLRSDPLPDFESSLKELEELVEKLENGKLSLQDSLACFERGVSLSRHCHGMLEQARHSVTVLTDPDDPGSEQPFDPNCDRAD
ncbi:MAG: exodeoxyribonuclease VII small subunit [Wenzhouxiangella sp.]